MQAILPNERSDWLNTEEIDGWDAMLPVGNTETKGAKESKKERAIFKLYSLGVVTARDEWVYDWSEQNLDTRLGWFLDQYEMERLRLEPLDKRKRRDAISDQEIKLTRALKNDLVAGTKLSYDSERNRSVEYRPFVRKHLHFWARLNEMQYQLNHLFPDGAANPTLTFRCVFSNDPLATLAVESVFDYGLLKTGNGGTDSLPRYRYTKSGERIDNITDWALNKFVKQYGKRVRAAVPLPHPADGPPPRSGEDLAMSKDAIFAYCYAVLHDPIYREKYALNLKREFPRIPFYPHFAQWAAWGEALMAMHIGYEAVEPFALERIETPAKRAEGTHPKPVLKSHPEKGSVVVDADTQLTGIPRAAWDYRLGNRSAIDWVLDQHKEKKPRDPTIAAKFNTYRFADYKESMIDLLGKVVRVSLDTVAITDAMRALDRSDWE